MKLDANLLQGRAKHVAINLIPGLVPEALNSMSTKGYLIVLLSTRRAAAYSKQIKCNHITALKLHSFSIWGLWAIIMLLSSYLFPSRKFSD